MKAVRDEQNSVQYLYTIILQWNLSWKTATKYHDNDRPPVLKDQIFFLLGKSYISL